MAGLHWNDQNVQEGSNANGNWRLYPEGTLWCWVDLTLTQDTTVTLEGTWTFPRQFAAPPFIFTQQGDDKDVDIFSNNAVQCQIGLEDLTETDVVIQLNRVPGTDSFGSNDYWVVHVLAIGEVAPEP